jgi:predicted regulator of Ras-like GTPase activity (Roadblock/LC7/MglB family)
MDTYNLTRQEELERILGSLFGELNKPTWVALVDSNGFIVACFPSDPEVEQERISAMTIAAVSMAERVLEEFDGEKFRYMSIVGAARQCMIVMLGKERLLSIGLPPGVQAQTTFGPIRSRIPELLKVLSRRFKF